MLSKHDELRGRVEARKHELLAKYDQVKADTRHEAAAARTRLKVRFDKLELHFRTGSAKVHGGARTKLRTCQERRD